MSCPYCDAALQCAVNCPNAPWNHDKTRTTRFGYLKRMIKWLWKQGWGLPLYSRPELNWI